MTHDQDRARSRSWRAWTGIWCARNDLPPLVRGLPRSAALARHVLTGEYANDHGVLGNGWSDGGFEAFDPARALPCRSALSGHRTRYVGKYLTHYHEATGVWMDDSLR